MPPTSLAIALSLSLASPTLPIATPSSIPPLPAAMEGALQVEVPEPSGPRVFIMPKREDTSRGVLKLVKHRNTTTTAVSSDTTLITNTYEEICNEPCGVRVDVSERPLFYFVRDGQPVSYAFRLHDVEDTVTLQVKPVNRGLLVAGVTLAVFLVGIPMWVGAVSRVWSAPGTPDSDAGFTRMKKARL